jgi:Predicted exporters of the RND superfamily
MDDQRDFWSWFGRWLARYRWGLLVFTAIVSVALIEPASRLKLDESIESLYDDKDPLLQSYLKSKQTFGGDEFVLVSYQTSDATDQSELVKLHEFAESLSQVPGVRAASTQDLWTTLRNPRASGIVRIALRLPATQRALMQLSENVLVGEDRKTVCIILRLEEEGVAGVPRNETFRQIRKLADEHDPPAYVAGEPVQIADMFRYVNEDSQLLGTASSILLALVILIFFRNIRWVLLPIIIIQVTLLWTSGLLQLSGMKLSMVSSMMTSLITVITVSTTMYVTVVYRDFRKTMSREDAFVTMFSRLAVPFFWVSLTTAIGFASLFTSGATPVRSFSTMMALGSMLIPLLCLLILPGGILIGKTQSDPTNPLGEVSINRQMERMTRWTETYPGRILGVTLLLALFGATGMYQLAVETDFTKNFRESSPVVKAVDYYEKHLGGAGSWDVAFSVPNRLEEVPLSQVRQLAEELRNLKLPDGTGLTKVVALTDGLELVPRIPVGEDERNGRLFRGLPRFREALLRERQEMLADLQPEMEPSLYNKEAGRMRIVLRSSEQQPAEVKLELIRRVEETASRYFPDSKASGLYVLLANMISSLLGDQLKSFGIAAIGMWACMSLALGGLGLGLMSLVPNLLPLLVVIGGMGWVGIPINIGTAMIASVSIGLTINNTILYLSDYMRVRRVGGTHRESVQTANNTSGMALLLANFALIVGFSVLALSNFIPMAYFGILVSLAMLGGVMGNLFLLPIMLKWILPEQPTSSPSPAVTEATMTGITGEGESPPTN